MSVAVMGDNDFLLNKFVLFDQYVTSQSMGLFIDEYRSQKVLTLQHLPVDRLEVHL